MCASTVATKKDSGVRGWLPGTCTVTVASHSTTPIIEAFLGAAQAVNSAPGKREESRWCKCSKLISWDKFKRRGTGKTSKSVTSRTRHGPTVCPDRMQPTLLHASGECTDKHEDARSRRTTTDQWGTKRQKKGPELKEKDDNGCISTAISTRETMLPPWSRWDAAHSAACFGGVHGQA